MIKTCRIDLPYDPERRMQDVARDVLSSVGLTLEQISVKSPYDWHNPSSTTHYGNWVIIPVRALPELESLNTDMPAFILELEDIQNLKPGDHVRVQYTNGLAGQNEGTGRVSRVSLDADGYKIPFVEIQKDRSSKGWRLYVSDSAAIWKI